MAKSTNFQTKMGSKVTIGTEVTMGTACLANGVTLEMPCTDYSFSDIGGGGMSLESAPFRTGLGGSTQSTNMLRARRYDRMFEVSLTFHGTAQAIDRLCLAMFGDGTTPNRLLGSMPAATNYEHDVASIVPVTIHFEDAAHAGTGTDIHFKSCMCTSFSLSGDIGSNGGIVMGTATFVTGYEPVESALTFTGGTHTLISDQTSIFNINDVSSSTITPSGGSAEDLCLYSFNLDINRSVNRIAFDTATNAYKPAGYVVGGYEVSGSLTVKRDDESASAHHYADTVEPKAAIDIDTGVFQVQLPTALIDNTTINMDDDGWKNVIGFRGAYDGATSNMVVEIGTAA